MLRLILTDLDHTLLRTDGSISDHTLAVLKRCRERGVLFAIATARYWIGAERYIDLLKPDYEITTDGTLIHSKGKCIYSCEFTTEETNNIVQALLAKTPDAEITVANGKTVYWNSKHIAKSEKLYKATYYEYDKPLECRANKIVAELTGISLNDIVAFGDDKNDIDMLKICGTGVAVSNAIKEVLDIADEITSSNDEDGVAEWIEKNLLC